eukprot:scaffold86_cov338-Pavlova_lutheri.AAC.83
MAGRDRGDRRSLRSSKVEEEGDRTFRRDTNAMAERRILPAETRATKAMAREVARVEVVEDLENVMEVLDACFPARGTNAGAEHEEEPRWEQGGWALLASLLTHSNQECRERAAAKIEICLKTSCEHIKELRTDRGADLRPLLEGISSWLAKWEDEEHVEEVSQAVLDLLKACVEHVVEEQDAARDKHEDKHTSKALLRHLAARTDTNQLLPILPKHLWEAVQALVRPLHELDEAKHRNRMMLDGRNRQQPPTIQEKVMEGNGKMGSVDGNPPKHSTFFQPSFGAMDGTVRLLEHKLHELPTMLDAAANLLDIAPPQTMPVGELDRLSESCCRTFLDVSLLSEMADTRSKKTASTIRCTVAAAARLQCIARVHATQGRGGATAPALPSKLTVLPMGASCIVRSVDSILELCEWCLQAVWRWSKASATEGVILVEHLLQSATFLSKQSWASMEPGEDNIVSRLHGMLFPVCKLHCAAKKAASSREDVWLGSTESLCDRLSDCLVDGLLCCMKDKGKDYAMSHLLTVSAVLEASVEVGDADRADLLSEAQVYSSMTLAKFCMGMELREMEQGFEVEKSVLHMLWDPMSLMSVQPQALESVLCSIADIAGSMVLATDIYTQQDSEKLVHALISQILKMHISVAPSYDSKTFTVTGQVVGEEGWRCPEDQGSIASSLLDTAISAALLRMAENLSSTTTPTNVRSALARDLLAHIVDLGWQAQEVLRLNHSILEARVVLPYVYRFGSLLPALAKACEKIQLTNSDLPQLRFLWLHMWTFKIASLDVELKLPYMWPRAWLKASLVLAAGSLPLIEAKEHLEVQVEIELQSLSSYRFLESKHSKEITDIPALGPAFASLLKAIPAERQCYISLALKLEMLRASSSSPETMIHFQAVQNGEYHLTSPFGCALFLLCSHLAGSHTEISKFLHKVVEIAFQAYAKQLVNWKADVMVHPERKEAEDFERVLTDLASFLITNSFQHAGGSDATLFHTSSLLYFKRLLEEFPELYWSKDCWKLLLLSGRTGDLLVDGPDAMYINKKTSLLKSALDVGSWMEEILCVAQGSASAFIQELMASQKEIFDVLSASRHPKKSDVSDALGGILHDFFSVHGMRSLFGGKILGTETILARANEFLDAEALNVPDRSSLFDATAVSLSLKSELPPSTLHRYIHFICFAPMKRVNGGIHLELLKTSVFCFEWMLAVDPELEPLITSKIAEAWNTQRSERVGVYADADDVDILRPRLLSPIRATEPGERPERSRWTRSFSLPLFLETVSAQKEWLFYLEGRWNVVKSSSRVSSSLTRATMCRMFQGLLQKPEKMTKHSAAVDVLFLLFKLSLQISYRREPEAVSLAHRVFTAALSFYVDGVRLSWFGLAQKTHSCRESLENFLLLLNDFMVRLTEHLGGTMHTNSVCGPCADDSLHEGVIGTHIRQNMQDLLRQGRLLQILCGIHLNKLTTWASPLSHSKQISLNHGMKVLDWRNVDVTKVVRDAWSMSPRLAVSLMDESMEDARYLHALEPLVVHGRDSPDVRCIPEAAPILAGCGMACQEPDILAALAHWEPCSVAAAVRLLSGKAKMSPYVQAYVVRVLLSSPPRDVAFFLPQLIQTLRTDVSGYVEDLLLGIARMDPLFAHRLIWVLGGEEEPPPEAFNPEVKRSGWEPPKETGLWKIVGRVRERVIHQMTAAAADFFNNEFDFFEQINSISGILKRFPKDERKLVISQELRKIPVTSDDLYLPTDPNARIIGIKCDSGVPLQSAAKVPILVMFDVEKEVENNGNLQTIQSVQGCIFKVGDDCRQDVLALQVIEILRDSFTAANLDLYLFPYGVLPTGYERGVIELVPYSASRSGLGEMADGGLLEIFKHEYGPIGSASFEKARENFIRSSAAYAIASYILQAKDRHNGNILLTKDGYMVHIDFGFIFEISPGGNLGFENAAFKLTHEMTQLLDPSGDKQSSEYKRFKAHCVRAFLVARSCMRPILTVVELMANSGLPCFGRGRPVENLRRRFLPDKNDREAASSMISIVDDAYDKWTTGFYDMIQFMQQGIPR